MAYTAIGDIIVPEVLGDQISAKFPDHLVLGNSNMVSVDGDFPLGSPGTTFKIPFWKRIGAFTALPSEGSAMTIGKIGTGAENAVVQRAGTALEVLDTAELVSKSDPTSEIADQIARRAAEYIDGALVTELQHTPNTFDQTGASQTNGAGTIDQNTLIKAMVATIGDNYNNMIRGGMFICHSKVFGDLVQTGAIQNQYQSGMDVIRTGTIPMIMGLPIMVSDLVTTSVVSSVTKYQSYILAPGALGLFYQRQVMVEFDRDILVLADIISSNVHFAAHLYGWDAVGAAVVAEQNKSIHAVNIKSN